jgi:phage tail-like protein
MTRAAECSSSFLLEIGGISSASFVRCSGLCAEVEVFEYAEGGAGAPRRLRGDVSWSSIVLERGVTRDREIHDWFVKGDRRDGAVILLGPGGREAARWAFTAGWPCRWAGPVLDARAAETAIEELEIAHEGIQWIER